MKKNKKKETIIINKESLKNYKLLSIGLENCENFSLDIADILDISCEAYKFEHSGIYGGNYRASDGFIKISSKARDALSDFSCIEAGYGVSPDYDEDEYKLYKRMTQCNDMCEFSLKDMSDSWKHIYVPYDALEDAIYHSEIDYANCPSFEIYPNGDMEIRFGKLSKNLIIPRNNYPDLVDEWREVLGGFKPKTLKLKVHNVAVEYAKDEESGVILNCTILNEKRKNEAVMFVFNDCDKINIGKSGKIKRARADMSKLSNGNIYFGIDEYFWISCKSCKVLEDWTRGSVDDDATE